MWNGYGTPFYRWIRWALRLLDLGGHSLVNTPGFSVMHQVMSEFAARDTCSGSLLNNHHCRNGNSDHGEERSQKNLRPGSKSSWLSSNHSRTTKERRGLRHGKKEAGN